MFGDNRQPAGARLHRPCNGPGLDHCIQTGGERNTAECAAPGGIHSSACTEKTQACHMQGRSRINTSTAMEVRARILRSFQKVQDVCARRNMLLCVCRLGSGPSRLSQDICHLHICINMFFKISQLSYFQEKKKDISC